MWLPDKAELNSLEKEYGDSFYLLDIDAFERNFFEFRDAFREHYAPTEIAYSYKTNYSPALCRKVDEWGGYAEVVSGMEYEIALKSGVDHSRIIFNGPYRTEHDLLVAIEGGATINVEAPYQIEMLESILQARPEISDVRIGVRANFGVDRVSRFGFSADSSEFVDAFRRLDANGQLSVKGVHCHFSTGVRSPENYGKIARRMIELAKTCFGARQPEFIDIGGGYFSKMSKTLKAQFKGQTYSYADYAAAIGAEFSREYGKEGGPRLILEPGVAVTADIGTFAAKVLDIRKLPDETFILVAGSIHNIKPTLNAFNLPVHSIAISDSRADPVTGTIVGYTCMEHDRLYEGFTGSVARGDWMVFENTGAYTNVMKQPFIRPAPPIVGCYKDEWLVVKRNEEMGDLMTTYRFEA